MKTIIGSDKNTFGKQLSDLNTYDIGGFSINFNEPNQDNFICKFTANLILLAVADGIGGLALGALASLAAVEILSGVNIDGKINTVDISSKFIEIRNRLEKLKQYYSSEIELGTTLTAAIISRDSINIYHTGDSCLCLFQNNKIFFQTKKQTLSEEVGLNLKSNILSSAIISNKPLNVVEYTIPRQGLESIVLMTDGVYESIDMNQIRYLLKICNSRKIFADTVKSYLEMRGVKDDSTMIALGLW